MAGVMRTTKVVRVVVVGTLDLEHKTKRLIPNSHCRLRAHSWHSRTTLNNMTVGPVKLLSLLAFHYLSTTPTRLIPRDQSPLWIAHSSNAAADRTASQAKIVSPTRPEPPSTITIRLASVLASQVRTSSTSVTHSVATDMHR